MRGYKFTEHTHQKSQLIESVNITGNVVPPQWLKHLKFENGKPHAIAALILSDIVYWYRPIIIRDEDTGQVTGQRKRFKADLLQRSYQSYVDLYGFTKEQVKGAFRCLAEVGVIELQFRTIFTEKGEKLGNVMFVDIFPNKLYEITQISPLCDSNPIGYNTTTPQLSSCNPIAMGLQPHTNTETTTETTTESIYPAEKLDPAAHLLQASANGVSEATAPNPDDQWLVSSKKFIQLWQEKRGMYPNGDEKTAMSRLVEERPDLTPEIWKAALADCNLKYTSPNGCKAPIDRVIEVAVYGGGDYDKWKLWKYGDKKKGLKKQAKGKKPNGVIKCSFDIKTNVVSLPDGTPITNEEFDRGREQGIYR